MFFNILHREDDDFIQIIQNIAKQKRIPSKRVKSQVLFQLVGQNPHQGVVLECSPLEFEEIGSLNAIQPSQNDESSPLWVALDEVTRENQTQHPFPLSLIFSIIVCRFKILIMLVQL